jgi:sugar phosphate isomerase/epimerase
MKLGCSTLLYGGYDLDTAIAGLREAGYEAVELGAIPGMGEHLRPGEAPATYVAIRDKLAAAGLALDAVACSGLLGTARLEPLLAAASAVGAPYVTLGSGGTADDEASWQEVLTQVRDALPACQQAGVKLSVKPHVRQAVHNVATARRFMEQLHSEWVGLNLDNTHLQRAGEDPVAAVGALQDWVFTARVRDYLSDDLSVGPLENQVPGRGQADVRGYLQALARVPGLHVVVLEMVGARDLALPDVQRVVGEALVALRSYQ